MELLAELSQDKDISLLVRTFLNATLRQIMRNLEAQGGSLFLFDPQTNELVLDSFLKPVSFSLKGMRQPASRGVSGQVLLLRRAVLVKDIATDRRFTRNGYDHYVSGSFVSVPLFVNGNVLGIMHIVDKTAGRYFSEMDLAFASTLCRFSCRIAENLVRLAELREQKKAIDEEKRALDNQAAIGKMAGGIVHEINNPLDGIIRYTNILMSQNNGDPGTGEYLREIRAGLLSIEGTTQLLLSFVRQISSPARDSGSGMR